MTTPHHLRCDWLEEARMRLLGRAIIFHDDLFVKVITMNDVIGELKKERKGCYDANSTLQPKPGHCGHEMRRIRSRPIAAALNELGKDPCLCCKYKPQGTCAYFLDGRKQEDACMDKLIYIKWMVRHAPDVAIRREAYEQWQKDALSRPRPPCEECHWQERIDKAKAEERERVLLLLEEWDHYNNRNFGKPHPVFADMIRLVREKPDEVKKHIESLRSRK